MISAARPRGKTRGDQPRLQWGVEKKENCQEPLLNRRRRAKAAGNAAHCPARIQDRKGNPLSASAPTPTCCRQGARFLQKCTLDMARCPKCREVSVVVGAALTGPVVACRASVLRMPRA